MNDLIFTTEGSLKGFKVAQTITDIITILLGFFMGCIFFAMREISDDGGVYFLLICGIVMLVLGFVNLLVTTVRTRTYINVYFDKVEGVGMQGLRVVSFNVQYYQINSISAEKDWIHIHTNIGAFKILTKKNLANQIVSYYNINIRDAR